MATKAAKKIHYIGESENYNLMAAYQHRIAENEKLLAEIQRLNERIGELDTELRKAREDSENIREMYLALRKGHYLLVPKS